MVVEKKKLFKELAKIDRAFFGIEQDRGFCTFQITLDYGGGGQGFGGYALDAYKKKRKEREGTAAGLDLMIQLLRLFNVAEFKDLKGKIVYALFDKEGWNRTIIGLEVLPFVQNGSKQFLIEDWQNKWFKKRNRKS